MVLVLWNWLISASKNLHFVSLQVCCHQSFGLHYASQPQFFPLALHFTCTERLRRNNLLPAPPHESTVSTGGLVPSSREPSSPERLREWRQGLQYHRSRGAPALHAEGNSCRVQGRETTAQGRMAREAKQQTRDDSVSTRTKAERVRNSRPTAHEYCGLQESTTLTAQDSQTSGMQASHRWDVPHQSRPSYFENWQSLTD